MEHLHESIRSAAETGDVVEDFRNCSLGYRRTALEHSTHYMVMFGGAVPGFEPSEENHLVAKAAFGLLVERVQHCIDAGAFAGDAVRIAEIAWGAMHGMVMLELIGIDPVGDDPAVRYEGMLDVLIAGLRPDTAAVAVDAGVSRG